MGRYRIGAVQVTTGKNPAENVNRVIKQLNRIVEYSPDFVLFPEMFEIVTKPKEMHRYAHTIPSEFTERLAELARVNRVNLIAGSFFEKDDDQLYNTSLVFDRTGTLQGKYRKMHLFDAFGFAESSAITPGDEPLLCTLDGLKFGVGICYDVRFPEPFRYYAVHGAEIVFLPAAFFQPNHDHWQLNIRSRALDNTFFVATCNQTGTSFVGRSMVADPWGVAITALGPEEGIYIAEIDTERIKEVRKQLPTLEGRHFDVRLRGR